MADGLDRKWTPEPGSGQRTKISVQRRLEQALAELDAVGASLPSARLAHAIDTLNEWRPRA